MRVLVTGGAGFVGRQIAETFRGQGHTVAVTVHQHDASLNDVATFQLDVRDETATSDIVASFVPDMVVHAAAVSDADVCERRPELARAVNVDGTRHVSTACHRHGAGLVFLSSSFVFSGDDDVYHENDARSPINVYGETKVAAENHLRETTCSTLIVRTDQPYGWPEPWQHSTMVTWLLDRLNADGLVPVFDDWWNSPIYNPDLADTIYRLVRSEQSGVFHVVGSVYLNRYTWARQIASVFDHDPGRIERSTAADSPLPAERPNAKLSTDKLRCEIGTVPPGVGAGLERMAASMN